MRRICVESSNLFDETVYYFKAKKEELGRGNKMCSRNEGFRGIRVRPNRVGLYECLTVSRSACSSFSSFLFHECG